MFLQEKVCLGRCDYHGLGGRLKGDSSLLEPEEEEIAIAGAGGLGFLRYWLWEEEGICCGGEPIRDEVK